VTPAGEHEGIPVSLLEAMSVGVPAIGTETGGMPALLGEGAGLLVPERDAEALASALERVLVDEELRAELGAAGRRRVEERFDVEVVAAELERRFLAAAGAVG
jgi:glycosyltransferase involved in cell wall biosynthesis